MAEIVRSAGEVLTVTQVTRYLKYLIETDELMSALSIRGEICEFTRSASGHLYFAIKDDGSQLGCVMFRREASRQMDDVVNLRKGVAVTVHGFLTVYEPRTACQLYVERIVLEGEGAAFRRTQALKDHLEREGLFAAERKRPLPEFPRKLALITSPGSQAYHDVLHRLQTQCPFVEVIVAGASVQGSRAADELVMAIDIVNRLTDADVILVVRGGGSPEDLASFNDERLARAIFASRVPVVTGIGHETDQSIADYVADVRAATPSLAAATAVPDIRGLAAAAAQLHRDAGRAIDYRLRHGRTRWLDANRALLRASPGNRLRAQHQRLDDLAGAAERSVRVALRERRTRLDGLRAQLATLDPHAVLRRGYAMLSDVETGRVISSTAAARPGARLIARVADGEIPVHVEE